MPRTVLTSLVLFASLLVGGCVDENSELVRVPDQSSAIRILVELEDAGVHGGVIEPVEGQRSTTYVVRVPDSELIEARRLLRSLELPRPEGGGFESLLGSSSLIPTATEERARLMHAMAGEIERTIELIDGVVAARVHLVLPNEERLRAPGESKAPSAIVLVKYRDGEEKPKIEGSENSDSGDWKSHLKQMVSSAMKGFTDGKSGKEAEPVVEVRATPVRVEGGSKSEGASGPALTSSGDAKAPAIWGQDREGLLLMGAGLLLVSTVVFLLLWLNERMRPEGWIFRVLRRSEG